MTRMGPPQQGHGSRRVNGMMSASGSDAVTLARALDAEQGADLCDVGPAGRACQQTIVPDAVEAVRQDLDQEAANKLRRGQPHHLLPVARFDAVILPAESDGLGIGADQARIRDRDPVGVSAQVSQHRLRAAERWLGVDYPFGFAEWGEPGSERLCF